MKNGIDKGFTLEPTERTGSYTFSGFPQKVPKGSWIAYNRTGFNKTVNYEHEYARVLMENGEFNRPCASREHNKICIFRTLGAAINAVEKAKEIKGLK